MTAPGTDHSTPHSPLIPQRRLGGVPQMGPQAFYRLARVFVEGRKHPPHAVCIHGVRIPWSDGWQLASATAIVRTIRMLLLRVHRSLRRLPDGWRWGLEAGVEAALQVQRLAGRSRVLSGEERWMRHLRQQGLPTDLRWGLGSYPVATMSQRRLASWSLTLLGVDGWGLDSSFHHLRYLCWKDRAGRHTLPVSGDSIPAALRSLPPAVVQRAKQAGRQILALPDLSGFIVEARRGDAMHSVLGWRWDASARLLHHSPLTGRLRYAAIPVPMAAVILPSTLATPVGNSEYRLRERMQCMVP